MRFVLVGTLAVLILQGGIASVRAASEPLISRFQDISRKACTIKTRSSPPQEHETEEFACRPFAGWTVRYAYHGAFVQAVFDPPGRKAQGHAIGAGSDIGERIEWYGINRPAGFSPVAGVLRLHWRADSGTFRSVLVLIRFEASKACAAAFVDAVANSNANEAIRQAVPQAAAFRCGTDRPAVIGKSTEWTAEAAARAP